MSLAPSPQIAGMRGDRGWILDCKSTWQTLLPERKAMQSDTIDNAAGTARLDQIDKLNELLRGEMSAVETYDIALGHMEPDSAARSTLTTCRDSHARRVELMAREVSTAGGTPSAKSGPWGAFAKVVETGATAFGEKVAIAALEEGEDKGLRDYREAIAACDGTTRELILRDVMPLQEQTHRKMSQLKQSYS
jgi:D-serine deaminase-like pyridoxal phosphate-dependent protein